MSYILNYNSIININHTIESKFRGSSKYKIIDGELIATRKDTRRLKELEKNQSINEVKTETSEKDSKVENTEQKEPQEIKKAYKLNKSKVKRKCHALSRLKKSKRFLAFYTISFPLGLSDKAAYKVFNTWLTRCRRNVNLKTYLWVAERQKNGTIHFHLLTNDYMPITTVNKFMVSSLKTEKKKGNQALKNVEISKYNGIDVKKVGKNKRGIISYLAKYISKNDIQFFRLPWHCSRDVSRLFTSTVFEEPESEKYLGLLPEEEDKYTAPFSDEENKFYHGVGFKFKPNDELFEDLDSANEIIYNHVS